MSRQTNQYFFFIWRKSCNVCFWISCNSYSCKQCWLIRQYSCITWRPARYIWEHYKPSHNKSHFLWLSDTGCWQMSDVDISVDIGSEKDSTDRDLESLQDTQECNSSLCWLRLWNLPYHLQLNEHAWYWPVVADWLPTHQASGVCYPLSSQFVWPELT